MVSMVSMVPLVPQVSSQVSPGSDAREPDIDNIVHETY